jgi:hypothetical protein
MLQEKFIQQSGKEMVPLGDAWAVSFFYHQFLLLCSCDNKTPTEQIFGF